MWTWHWSPLTQTSLLLSPSDGLASYLKTTLANGVKVVKKVITSKFSFFFYSNICIGMFSQFQLHTCTYQNYLEELPPNTCEASERMNFNVIDKKKQLIWKLFIYLFIYTFLKKMSQNVWATHLDQWLIFYWPKKKISGQPKALIYHHTINLAHNSIIDYLKPYWIVCKKKVEVC